MSNETVQDFIERVVGYCFDGIVRIEPDDQTPIIGTVGAVVNYLNNVDYTLYTRGFIVDNAYSIITIYAN